MSDTPNSKVKGISFNLDNAIEKYMFEYSAEMKDRKESFSQLMKHLFMGYLINIGKSPPGIAHNPNILGKPPVEDKKEEVVKKKPKVKMNMLYARGEE
jgi:hypothetical protein